MCDGDCRACTKRAGGEGVDHWVDEFDDETRAFVDLVHQTGDGSDGSAAESARVAALGHAGEWRDQSGAFYCSTASTPEGRPCAHTGIPLRSPHYSCCGGTDKAARCGGVASAGAGAGAGAGAAAAGTASSFVGLEEAVAVARAVHTGAHFTISASTSSGAAGPPAPRVGDLVRLRRAPAAGDSRCLTSTMHIGVVTAHVVTARANTYTVHGPGSVVSAYEVWEVEWTPTPVTKV